MSYKRVPDYHRHTRLPAADGTLTGSDDKRRRAGLPEGIGTAAERAKAAAIRGDADAFRLEAATADALRHQLLETGLITAEQFVEYGRDLAEGLEQAGLPGRYQAARREGTAGECVARMRHRALDCRKQTHATARPEDR